MQDEDGLALWAGVIRMRQKSRAEMEMALSAGAVLTCAGRSWGTHVIHVTRRVYRACMCHCRVCRLMQAVAASQPVTCTDRQYHEVKPHDRDTKSSAYRVVGTADA